MTRRFYICVNVRKCASVSYSPVVRYRIHDLYDIRIYRDLERISLPKVNRECRPRFRSLEGSRKSVQG